MIAILLIGFFAFICWKKQSNVIGRYDLLLAFGFKLLTACFYFYYYVYIYGNGNLNAGQNTGILLNGDFYTFFHESKLLNHIFYESPSDFFKIFFGIDESLAPKYLQYTEHWTHVKPGIINDSQNVMRVNSLIYFISQGSIAVHFILVNALVLFSTHFFIEKFAPNTKASSRMVFWLLILLPSFAFSNTSIIKEPFLFSGIVLCLGAVFNQAKKTFVQWQFYVGLLLMIMFKGYVLLFLFPIVSVYFLSRFTKVKFTYSISGVIICFLFALFFIPSFQFKITRTLSEKQHDFMNIGRGGVHLIRRDTVIFIPNHQLKYIEFKNEFFVKVPAKMKAYQIQKGKIYPYLPYQFEEADTNIAVYYRNLRANSYFEPSPINNSFTQLIKNTPEALFRAAFCPTLMDVGGWKIKFNFFETVFVFCFLTYFFYKHRKDTSRKDRDFQLILILTALLLFLLIGYTTPVYGAIIRYRLPAFLFLIVASLLSNKNELIRKAQQST